MENKNQENIRRLLGKIPSKSEIIREYLEELQAVMGCVPEKKYSVDEKILMNE